MVIILTRLVLSIMFGPAADVKAVYDAAGAQLFDEQIGVFSFPCKSPPAISFNWGGEDWEISPENISLGETEQGSGQGCLRKEARGGNKASLISNIDPNSSCSPSPMTAT